MAEQKSTLQNTVDSIKRGIDNANAAVGRWAGRAIGTALGGVGGLVGGQIGDFIGRHARQLAQAIAAWFAAQMILSFILTVVAAVVLVIFAAFAMFIINSGAYIVPPGQSITFRSGTSIVASGSCPLTGNVRISVGSYNPQSETGHGSNQYWNALEGFGETRCSFNVPVDSIWPDCWGPSSVVPNSSDNYCANNANGTCPYYGYALDVVSDNRAVFLPSVCGAGATTCAPMEWTLASVSTSSGGGSAARFTSTDNGHSWTLVFLHIDLTIPSTLGATYQSGTQVATLTNMGDNTHLHIELAMDSTPIRPDFLCGGTTPGSASARGWIVSVPASQLSNLMASTPSEYFQQSCSWAGQKSLTYAINANLYEPGVAPDGPAGYDDSFTNVHLTTRHDNVAFLTFVLDSANNPRIIGPYRKNTTPAELSNLNQYKLAVTGVSEDSWSSSVASVRQPRTVLGLDSNNNVYLGVFQAATISEALATVRSNGASQAFTLDGGGSSTFCQGGQALFGGSRNVANSIGTFVGDIIILE